MATKIEMIFYNKKAQGLDIVLEKRFFQKYLKETSLIITRKFYHFSKKNWQYTLVIVKKQYFLLLIKGLSFLF